MNTARPAGMLAHGGRSIVDWFTGTGLLAINALAFFGALVVLVPWNIYTSPGDFWTADLFIPWAFVLGFHALLVGVWALIRQVILKDDNPLSEMTPTARQWQAARAKTSASAINFRTAGSSNPAAASAAAALYAEEWRRQSVIEHEPGTQSSSRKAHSDQSPARPADIGDLLADWDTSWPESAEGIDSVPSREDSEPDSPAITADTYSDLLAEPTRTPGPLSAAARAASSEERTVDPELEWQWIEAAASAWLSNRESQASQRHHESGTAGW